MPWINDSEARIYILMTSKKMSQTSQSMLKINSGHSPGPHAFGVSSPKSLEERWTYSLVNTILDLKEIGSCSPKRSCLDITIYEKM